MKRPIRAGIVGAGMTVPWFLEAAAQIPEMGNRGPVCQKRGEAERAL